MQKIPTLFQRDPQDRKRVLPEANPVCQWVLDGEGIATRKYDGTCVLLDADGTWWARREVRPSRTRPPGYRPVMTDEVTGKTVGWEPIAQSAYARYHAEAATSFSGDPGTYELIGEKINGNPEGVRGHALVAHAKADRLDVPRDLDGLRTWLLAHPKFEGIVWHHPDGRRAKIKYRDFA
ncbi:hypothetical protein FHR83_001594 [Actinoplanes campanulatus]|uniref:Mucin-1 n=1 Tax=Actinoplanes campanulatus TaxID=113559 RepID=A0A7W5ADA6_9ACTN|nr:DUF5565 family protein [Actinoplanes campanulatus]MBB3093945.1 hypothetical protein [Actinoplanes campanulatus]GGN33636.1 hypothetical protein GCM10010109_55850 [Actinoplanes campanulatus]GID38360.1 hypothetical protein Aca09nite_48660 [Actinoplanes campanulatus]